jgi:hypothetical protein
MFLEVTAIAISLIGAGEILFETRRDLSVSVSLFRVLVLMHVLVAERRVFSAPPERRHTHNANFASETAK